MKAFESTNQFKNVERAEFAEFVNTGTFDAIPIEATMLCAMQYVDRSNKTKLMAQAVYYKGSKPSYQIRKD